MASTNFDSVGAGSAMAKLPKPAFSPRLKKFSAAGLRRLADVNRELWLLLSLFVLAALVNSLLDSHRMLLGLYTLPTLFSAYVYGRRHATLTAMGSALLVVLVAYFNPVFLAPGHGSAAG